MNEKVKAFLDAKKVEERKAYEKEKQKTLIELGLYEIEYSEKEVYSNDFPYYEYDNQTLKNKWYKKIPLEVTDEEYEEVKKYSKKEERKKQELKKSEETEINPIATALRVIAGVIFIAGFIAGIILGNVEVVKGSYYTYTTTEFSFEVAFTYWCIALISGTMFLGFAEIIKLLEDIKKK